LFEFFLPGNVVMQNRYGALQLVRSHGDVLDVFNVVSQLVKDVKGSFNFLSKDDIQAEGVNFKACAGEARRALIKKGTLGKVWGLRPQPDDAVKPYPDICLADDDEQLVFNLSFKNVGSTWSGRYNNTDVILTTGRVFIWDRMCYKKFDCMSLPCWCCCWVGCLNPLFAPRNLPNAVSFLTLPSLLSFSSDLDVDPPSWLTPHHTPLKIPFFEMLCHMLTKLATCDRREVSCSLNCLPKRSTPSTTLSLMWRLRQSAHAESDMIVLNTIKPYAMKEISEEEAEDIYTSMGLSSDPLGHDSLGDMLHRDHVEKVETLRKIMCVVQDMCHRTLDKIDMIV